MLILGIDDAGRGPVIGPMVLAGVLIEEEDNSYFRKIGVKDSKQLSPEVRAKLAKEIKKRAKDFHIAITEAYEIDARLNAGVNLNKVEAIKAAEIINAINKGKKHQEIIVIIDCPSPNTKKWRDYVKEHVNNLDNLSFKVEHKADVNHASCSAASILAKVTRDNEIEKIKKKIGIDFGSGYPSDPVTKKFLEEHGRKYKSDRIFRETWQTFQNQEKKNEQKSLEEF